MKKYEILALSLYAILGCTASSSDRSSSKRSTYESSSNECDDNGYIFTSPRSLKLGARNEFQLQRFCNYDAGVLKVKIVYKDSASSNESIATEKYYDINEGDRDTFLDLYLNKSDKYVYDGDIEINGTFGDYTIGGSGKVYFRSSSDFIVLIQTDKPLYKEGQTVYFRVLVLDNNLKPYKNAKYNILVEDPKSNKLFQWKDVVCKKGIKQFQFPLADEPVQGNWKISVTVEGQVTTTRFEVKEYVLPKFDVTIKIPPYVLVTATEIPITICANYTYGKPVQGDLHMNISLEKYYWSNEKIPTQEYEGEIDGCFDYNINVSTIETDENQLYRRIYIIASVEEAGTGIQRNKTQFIQREFNPLNLKFKKDQPQFYKPGLPYNGELIVNYPDNTPATEEGVQICYTVSRERVIINWFGTRKVKFCKNYTSDEEGKIEYIIPPQSTDSVGITLNAISLKYVKNDNGTQREKALNQPQTSMSLKPWYSPSGSFIQLQPIEESLHCGTTRRFKLLFTSKESAVFKFYYQVVSQGYVVQTGYVKESFSTDDDVSNKFDDECKLINDEEIQLVPPIDSSKPPPSDENCPSARDAKYMPPIGEASIILRIDPSWTPIFRLLIFYVRDDRETVADSQKFSVAPCFRNQVKMQFRDAVQQPGAKTSLRVSASPNSLCGIKVIDKSVSLLNSNDDQLTKEKIIQILKRLDTGIYYEEDHCNDNALQPGLPKKSLSSAIILPPRPQPYSYSSYEDSLTAFETAGFLVISDLVLLSRPCKSRGSSNDIVYASNGGRRGGSNVAFRKSVARAPAAGMGQANADMESAPTQSIVELRNFFPETWLFKLEMTDDDGEIVTKETLPHTITEWVGSAVCINSEDGLGISNQTSIRGFQAFFISITLPYSCIRGEQFPITISIFNYVEDSLPVTYSVEMKGFDVISGSTEGDTCVKPGTSKIIKVLVKATELGTQNITVRAETAESPDVCDGSSVSDAYARDAVENSVIVAPEGWPAENTVSALLCPSDDGNGMYSKTFSLSVPEDNYVNGSARAFLYVTGNILGIGLDNLGNLVVLPTGCGEQNMAKFAPNVVAYEVLESARLLTDQLKNEIINNLVTGAQRQMQYRHSDGSYSAFGDKDKEGSMFLTSFVLRYYFRAAKYILIENSTLVDMQKWIENKQLPNGCFPNVGKIFDTGLGGGVEKDKTNASITAYVLASLEISEYTNETVKSSALRCIQESQDKSFYATFLYAYTECLVGDQDSAKERISGANERATTKGGVEYFQDINATKSQTLETAAYAVLSTLKCDGTVSEVLPIVQYLTQNLSPRGGFSSTQDTCVGFEALGEVAKRTITDDVDIRLTCSGGFDKVITVTEEDKLLLKKYKIPDVPSEVNTEAEGTGCVIVQSVLRYNTNTSPEKRFFNIEIVGKCLEDKCQPGSISITISYVPEDQKTGMALVEVNMISGIVPVKESLEKCLADPNLQLMRYEVVNNVVIFYFSQLSNANKSFSFNVERVILVENAQPGNVKAYDYYDRDTSGSATYTFKDCDDASCRKEL